MILIIPFSGCLQKFPTSLLCMSSNLCLIRHGSSSTNRHGDTAAARAVQAARSCVGAMPAAARRATISTVTAIAVITAARRSRVSNGPCRGRGGFADAGRPCGAAWHCQPPRRLAVAGPPAATAGPLDCQAVPAAGRPTAASAGRTALSADAAATSRRTIV